MAKLRKEDVLKIMKGYYGNSFRFSERIDINLNGNVCELKLNAKCVKEENMQNDCNAFEGWSIVLFTALNEKEKYKSIKIRLCLDDYTAMKSNEIDGHMTRFLYRAKCFCEQYTWFELDKVLKEKVEVFPESEYINNVPKGEAGIKSTHNNESEIEAVLAEGLTLSEIIGKEKGLVFGDNSVYRQLPVGLFRNEVKEENRVFTGGKSAIDLWSWNDDNFHVVELKAQNPMIGIITEIFFYANFMRDLLVSNRFKLNEKGKDRGYKNILELHEKFKKINGIMLADKYHSTLENRTEEILKVMNDNGDAGIQYHKIDYNSGLKATGGSK